MKNRAALFIVCVVVLRCSSSTTIISDTEDRKYIIPYRELQNAYAENIFDVIRELRPLWFRDLTDHQKSLDGYSGVMGHQIYKKDVVIFWGGTRYQGIEHLEQISLDSVRAVKYYTMSDALKILGSNENAPVVIIEMASQ